MTTSGTYAFQFPFDDVVAESWSRCGKNAATLTGEVAASARTSLFLMSVDWTNRDVPLWQVSSMTLALTARTSTYALPANVVDALDVYVTVSGMDRFMSRMSRDNFAALPMKDSRGPPTQYWVNRQAPATELRLFPTPDQAYTLTVWYLRQPQDVSLLSATPDAPILWSDALAAGLAERLAEKFVPDRLAEKMQRAETAWNRAHGENRERVPLAIIPEWGLR